MKKAIPEMHVKHLTAGGKSGILEKFKLTAANSKNKSLKRTSVDNARVNALIREYDSIQVFIKKQGLNNRLSLEHKHLKLMYRLIKLAVINQGFISNGTLARFKFNPVELVEKITYRNLLEKFVTKSLVDGETDEIRNAVLGEAKKGEYVDINLMSDEFYDWRGELRQFDGSGEFTDEEMSAGWLKWSELKNRDKSLIYKKQARTENLCYYISTNPQNSGLKIISKDRILSLSTSNLEKLVFFYCKAFKAHNINAIKETRKSDKRLSANPNYVHKKTTTANEKREMVKDLKAEGKTQIEVANIIGCSERTVRTYWQ